MRHRKGEEWNPSATLHPRTARQNVQFFSRLVKCQNGSVIILTSGFSLFIGLSQARPTLRSLVVPISTTSQSTSIPSHPGHFLPAWQGVSPTISGQQIPRSHWRRYHSFLRLHVDGCHVSVIVGDISYLDEPLPTHRTFVLACD